MFQEHKYCLIDMTILSDKNISAKELDKLWKYMYLEIEIIRIWHLNTSKIPVELGMFKKNVKKIPRIPFLFKIQKTIPIC